MTPTVYVICDNNCKYEGMTKEQILAAIMQAVTEGTIGECDTGFVTTIKTINGHGLKFFVGTKAEYDSLSEEAKADLFAIITDDTTKEGLFTALETLQNDYTEFKNGVYSGNIVVPRADRANNADNADRATLADKATNVVCMYYHIIKLTVPILDKTTLEPLSPFGIGSRAEFTFTVTTPSPIAPSIQFLARNKGVKLPYTGVFIYSQRNLDITSYTFDGINSQNDYINATIDYNERWQRKAQDGEFYPYDVPKTISFCFYEIEREVITIALN